MATKEKEQRLLSLLADTPRTAADLCGKSGISQPTFSRLVVGLGDSVVKLGRGRATLYGRLRNIREAGNSFPVYRIDEQGDAHRFGLMTSVWDRQFWWEPTSGQPRLFRHLPWFVQELRPEGFVGRAFAHRLHGELQFPTRLLDWNDDDVVAALARRGDDCMGNLVIGDESLGRYLQSAQLPVVPVNTDDYPHLAREALAGDPAGSSAGGEQPKFTTVIEDNGTVRHVLVKFSPVITSPEGERWSDLLVCEHLALEVIQDAGFSASPSVVFSVADRTFLQVDRFDRTGRFGRLPLYSLGVVDDEFFGRRDTWCAMADRLKKAWMLSSGDASALRLLSLFGGMIANTDQHFGNASLIPTDELLTRFRLAPAYDMLPMLYRPLNGEALCPTFIPPPPTPLREWSDAHRLALVFWERAARDERISLAFRKICAENHSLLLQTAAGPRLT